MGVTSCVKYPRGQSYQDAKADGIFGSLSACWVRDHRHEKTIRQSAETTDQREGAGIPGPADREGREQDPGNVEADWLTLKDGAELMRWGYTSNGRKSAASLKYCLAHVVADFSEETRLSRITTGAIEIYRAERLKAGAKPATVNRELACLSRLATLARKQ